METIWLRLLAVALLCYGCDFERYPLAATFCDDWCRTMLRTSCEPQPSACVETCETYAVEAECSGHQQRVLECFDDLTQDEFSCGVRLQTPSGEPLTPCRSEVRACLFCRFPEVKECLSTCEELERNPPASCQSQPAGELRCEDICWFAAGFRWEPATCHFAPHFELSRDPSELLECVYELAYQCGSAPTSGDAGAADASVAPTPADSIGDQMSIAPVPSEPSGTKGLDAGHADQPDANASRADFSTDAGLSSEPFPTTLAEELTAPEGTSLEFGGPLFQAVSACSSKAGLIYPPTEW